MNLDGTGRPRSSKSGPYNSPRVMYWIEMCNRGLSCRHYRDRSMRLPALWLERQTSSTTRDVLWPRGRRGNSLMMSHPKHNTLWPGRWRWWTRKGIPLQSKQSLCVRTGERRRRKLDWKRRWNWKERTRRRSGMCLNHIRKRVRSWNPDAPRGCRGVAYGGKRRTQEKAGVLMSEG